MVDPIDFPYPYNLIQHNFKQALSNNVKIFGLYGKDDGLYSEEQVSAIEKLIGNANLIYYDNCSHSVFIDKQTPFIEALNNWIK